MRRAYNTNISERANRSLARREAQVRGQKFCIVLTIVFVIIVGILFGTGIQVYAGKEDTKPVQKYYKTICVEAGDTLWDIAVRQTADFPEISIKDYIKKVKKVNRMEGDDIQSGNYLLLPTYCYLDE